MMRSLTVPGPGPNVPRPSRMIPVPDIPVRPVLSLATFAGKQTPPVASILDVGPKAFVTAGRVAIALALQAMGVKEGKKVLVPAFHCASMVDPVFWARATPVFYRIRDDFSVDLDDLARKLDPETRVLMATHYFGFPQNIVSLRQFCDDHGLGLLEDCAHAFFGTFAGRPLGSYGDYAIASLTKFFPVPDGGCLVSAKNRVDGVHLRGQGARDNLRGLWSSFNDSLYHGHLKALSPFLAAARWINDFGGATNQTAIDEAGLAGESINPALQNSGVSSELDSRWIDVRAQLISRTICRFTPRRAITDRRRKNYEKIFSGLTDTPGCRPAVERLPDETIPYMFPLWIDDLESAFPRLEDAAIPMLRFGQFLWPTVDNNVCPTSVAFSRHLVQFPCHQDLSDGEIDWIVDQVRGIVSSTSGRG